MRRGWVDRVLVGAALLLVAGVAVQGIASWLVGGDGPKRSAPETTPEPTVPAEDESTVTIQLTQGSSSLEPCSFDRLRFDVRPGPVLRLSYLGPACAPPMVDLEAVVRDPQGAAQRRVPALDPEGVSVLMADVSGVDETVAPLASGLLRCRSGRPDGLRLGRDGLVKGSIPCRAQR